MSTRPDPQGVRVGSVRTLADLPAPTAPGFQVGDRMIVRIGPAGSPIVATLVQDDALAPRWCYTLGTEVLTVTGVALLDAAGQLVVVDAETSPGSRFVAFYQPKFGPPPSGVLYTLTFTPGVGFTLASSAGAADAGWSVYYQRWEVIP